MVLITPNNLNFKDLVSDLLYYYGGGGGGGGGEVIVYSVANYRSHYTHFWVNVTIFFNPESSHFLISLYQDYLAPASWKCANPRWSHYWKCKPILFNPVVKMWRHPAALLSNLFLGSTPGCWRGESFEVGNREFSKWWMTWGKHWTVG